MTTIRENATIIGKLASVITERRLPWRLSRWMDRRRLDAVRTRADRDALLTEPMQTGRDCLHFEVHVLLGRKHVGMTLWCVKSLLWATGRKYVVVLHDDGSLTDKDVAQLERHLLGARVVRRPQADALIRDKLQHLPHAMSYRYSPKETSDHRGQKYDMHIFALRLFDFNLMSNATKTLVLDCDILFFKPPLEIMGWAEDPHRRGSLFSIEQYVPLRNVRYEITGYRRKDPLPTDANCGLLCLDKGIHDLGEINAWIGRNLDKMDRLATFEQHAYNHLLQTKGGGTPLPDTYSFNYTDDRVVASHFAIKHLFFENLHRLKSALTKG